jgi:branched-chain amino acid transport system substrate-binding protein
MAQIVRFPALPSALTRRRIITAGAAGAASLALTALAQARNTIKIGYITALSGVRANFGEAD